MGLDGLFIVHDAAEAALPLPRQYGVDDIPLVVQDVRFDDDGQFDTGVKGYIGTLGDQVLVNGSLGAHFDVATTVVRLRLVNGSPARVYDFGFDDGRRFAQIASDGGLLEAPADVDAIELSPGERAEILVTLTPGETTVLRSTPPELGMNMMTGERNGAADSFDLLELRAAGTLATVGTVPAALVPIERLVAADAAQTRAFVLSDNRINNERMDMSRVDVVALLDTTEVWVVDNSMAQPHSFHVHGLQFQVLDVDGTAPPPGLAGWKDTVYVPPGSQYRLILRFEDYADPRTPYMFHCHLLRHEDDGMMGQFVVVEPGDEQYAGVSAEPAAGHDGHGG
jgi:bilirubin oxidase